MHLDLLSNPRSEGKNVKTFRWDHRLQIIIQNLFYLVTTLEVGLVDISLCENSIDHFNQTLRIPSPDVQIGTIGCQSCLWSTEKDSESNSGTGGYSSPCSSKGPSAFPSSSRTPAVH